MARAEKKNVLVILSQKSQKERTQLYIERECQINKILQNKQ